MSYQVTVMEVQSLKAIATKSIVRPLLNTLYTTTSTTKHDLAVDCIESLCRYGIEPSIVWECYPQLAHISKVTVQYCLVDGQQLNDWCVQWFLDNYQPADLPSLMGYSYAHVSKRLLQKLLQLCLKDRQHLEDIDISKFIYACLLRNCKLKTYSDLLIYVRDKYIWKVFKFATRGALYDDKIWNVPDDIWLCDAGKRMLSVWKCLHPGVYPREKKMLEKHNPNLLAGIRAKDNVTVRLFVYDDTPNRYEVKGMRREKV